ncbi:MAG: hypothetical protein UV64_C0007G0047 [Parcubacteria group bacterium GW2011_GWC1_43_11b]|nr:MAG: hypothetical protein UV64_C0007G0047 [Parcubacteria group bacterium GW2011_GWC1_43_11b]
MKLLAERLPKEIRERLLEKIKTLELEKRPHFQLRMAEKGITWHEVDGALRSQTLKLIEAHDEVGTRRLLVRDTKGTCVVVDIDTKELVTTYKNSSGDNHSTLNRSVYFQGQLSWGILKKWA